MRARAPSREPSPLDLEVNSMTADTRPGDTRIAPAAEAPGGRRLLAPHPLRSLDAHLDWYGSVGRGGPDLIDEVASSALRGKGGARFPAATKLAAVAAVAAVAARRRPI